MTAFSQRRAIAAFWSPVNVFDLKVSYDTFSADGVKTKNTADVKAKAHFVKPGDEKAKPVEALDKIVALEIGRAHV